MNRFQAVFIVLTYINSNDLKDFLESVKKLSFTYKVIVVDAYHDGEASAAIKKIAEDNCADYLRISNKGYSYGNNYGINYAKKEYDFDFLIISNPDIEVEKFEIEEVEHLPIGCYGPYIKTKSGKNQNPMYYRRNNLSRRLIYYGLKKNRKPIFFSGILCNKMTNMIFKLLRNNRVYQLHGSFIIIHKDVIKRVECLFDEKMFLFAEESYLARKLEDLSIPSYYIKTIRVNHKEDGSMKFLKDINKHLIESNIYVFEQYYK